ncbi:MAG: polysaccharide deacetylase family protein [Christensenella sp.]|uniref:polysaccharide deacetylase family protein n=1 Tax=Christensenella sp. TaxID=1935934 RepID=UPI002B209ACB|nr:polysaccharide deacetylase family protein [Christensenella sp.]MEA5002667.1 polysaccharide deacetylase family protein [Christensenella sp.]
MKRIFLMAITVLLTISLLVGCAGQPASTPSPAPSATVTATPSPPPTETPAPSPTPSEAPSPTPSPTPEPTPTKTPIEALHVDYEALRALDGTKDGWGQGLEKDALNRPTGSLSAQETFGKYDAQFIMPEEQKFYLTFDEGYENGRTSDILDTLKAKDQKATFFVTYSYVRDNPALVERMIAEGHVIGNHSMTHRSMPDISLEEARDEIVGLHQYMRDTYGIEMTVFRPPMGEYSQQTLALAQMLGYKSAFWSFAYYDYEPDDQMPPAEALAKITKNIHPGALYLLHAVSGTNAQILGDFIDEIRAQGYEILPLQ